MSLICHLTSEDIKNKEEEESRSCRHYEMCVVVAVGLCRHCTILLLLKYVLQTVWNVVKVALAASIKIILIYVVLTVNFAQYKNGCCRDSFLCRQYKMCCFSLLVPLSLLLLLFVLL